MSQERVKEILSGSIIIFYLLNCYLNLILVENSRYEKERERERKMNDSNFIKEFSLSYFVIMPLIDGTASVGVYLCGCWYIIYIVYYNQFKKLFF